MADKIMTVEDYAQQYPSYNKAEFIPFTNEKEQEIFAKAKAHADKILNAKSISPSDIKGNCFYISANGDDFNDGRSEATPWKTVGRLHVAQNDGTVNEGDGVFFERGCRWNSVFHSRMSGDYALMMRSGVTYSAYGEGYKPMFTNCAYASSPDDWSKTLYKNIWVYNYDVGNRYSDVGNIIFDDGKGFGIKVSPHDPCSPFLPNVKTVDCGMVTNGMGDVFHSGDTYCTSPAEALLHNLEFLHDPIDGKLYLYFDKGNPAEYFNEIILAKRGNVISCSESKDILIDNIAVKYCGSHGITTSAADNVTIQNCIFGWIGGSLQGTEPRDVTRYGNAVENWGICNGQYINNCIVYQCYDAGLTTQVASWDPEYPVHMARAEYCDNVMAYTNSPLELWNSNPPNKADEPYVNCVKDSKFTGNYLFYSGYHFGHQRPCKNGSFGCLGGKAPGQVFVDTEMSNNVFMYTSSFAHYTRCIKVLDQKKGITTANNTYVLGTSKYYIKGAENSIENTGGPALYPYSPDTMGFFESLGAEKDSTYYYYDGNLFEEEEQGVYLYINR